MAKRRIVRRMGCISLIICLPESERETFRYPGPLTEEFCRIYAEPFEDFLGGMFTLDYALTSISSSQDNKFRGDRSGAFERGAPVLNGLLAAASPMVSP